MNAVASFFRDVENAHYPNGTLAPGLHVFRRYCLADGSIWDFAVNVAVSGTQCDATASARRYPDAVTPADTQASEVFSQNLSSINTSKVSAIGAAKGWIAERSAEMFGTGAFVTTDSDDAL